MYIYLYIFISNSSFVYICIYMYICEDIYIDMYIYMYINISSYTYCIYIESSPGLKVPYASI